MKQRKFVNRFGVCFKLFKGNNNFTQAFIYFFIYANFGMAMNISLDKKLRVLNFKQLESQN